MDSVDSRSLLECKLRRCVYLGTRYYIYIPPVFRDQFWGKNYVNHRFDFHLIKTIGNAVNKNDVEIINSIVPILKKINQENPLNGDKHLIFALAVCAKFNLNQCKQMVRDAYDTVDIFCTDGMKLLMFAKYCTLAAEMLYDYGYLPYAGKGLSGNGFRKAISRWYSKRNSLETIQLILQCKNFQNMTHKKVMNNIKYFSDDPVHKIIIIYIMKSMNDVKVYYDMMKRGSRRDSNNHKELTFSLLKNVYTYLHEYHNSLKISSKYDIQRFRHFIRLHLIGRQHDVLPHKWQYDLNFLPSYVEHMPLRSLLSKTCCMAKNGLFCNLNGNEDCLTFINRFNHRSALKKSQIHPIESYITFLRYAKTGQVITELKKPKNWEWKDFYNKIDKSLPDYSKSLKENNNIELIQPTNDDDDNNNNNTNKVKLFQQDSIFFIKPKPKYSDLLMKLLSNDLVAKTLDNIELSYKCRMFIAYDSRQYLATRNCRYPHLKVVKMIDAITMIILSLIYQMRGQPTIRPTIVAMNDTPSRFTPVYVDYKRQRFTLEDLKETLFSTPSKRDRSYTSDKDVKPIYPLSTMNWARKRKQRYDIFFFLGTHKTDLKHLKRIKAEYSNFLKKRVKTVFCCLSGKYKDQINLSREGMFFIPGFDKHIGQIIQSYINQQF